MAGSLKELAGTPTPISDEKEAYERVLTDAMAGDATLFARQDYVEEAWRIVDPVLTQGTPVYEYEPNSWGPRKSSATSSLRTGGMIRWSQAHRLAVNRTVPREDEAVAR